MKAIVNTAAGRLEMLDWPMPRPRREQVLIRAGACGICATDLAMIAGWERTGFPAIAGHEWAGVIAEVGEGVDAALIGRRCVGENVWSTGGEVGFEHPGGYAEYFVTEAAKIQVLPDGFPLATASLIEPLAVVVRGRRRLGNLSTGRESLPPTATLGQVIPSGPLVILGDGPIGLLMLMLLEREPDCQREGITVVGGRECRLALAAELGAERTLNYHQLEGDLASAIHRETRERYHIIVEATGSGRAMEAALELVRPGGRILVLGDYGRARAAFCWGDLLHREIVLIGSNASAGAWPEAVRLAVTEGVPLNRLISHRIPVARFAEAIALARSGDAGTVKVVLEWGD
jgi:threonine dehydrogenase-like Zn-dependent dehydrogenase